MKLTASTINDSVKAIICVDISCEFLGIPFDDGVAVSLSCMRIRAYQKNRNTFLKLLNFNKTPDVPALMRSMQIPNKAVEETAKKLQKNFKEKNEDLDLDHPQYVAMSVYQACKLEKVKVFKKPFIRASNLTPQQWSQMEKKWDSFAGDTKSSTKKTSSKVGNGQEIALEAEPVILVENLPDELLDYDEWAKRTIAKAEAELKSLQLLIDFDD